MKNMKKYIILAVLALGFVMSLNAQSDGFFSSSYSVYRETTAEWGTMPMLPGSHGYEYNYAADEAPLGSGALLLAGLGLAYAMRNKNRK